MHKLTLNNNIQTRDNPKFFNRILINNMSSAYT